MWCVLTVFLALGLASESKADLETSLARYGDTATSISLAYDQSVTRFDNCTFCRFTELTSLTSYSNRLSFIHPNAFGNTKISRLYLFANLLTEFPDLTVIAGTLTYLEIYYNRISKISVSSMEPLTLLSTLSISNNPLVCDCELAWLPQYVAAGLRLDRADSTLCDSPTEVAGQKVLDVTYPTCPPSK